MNRPGHGGMPPPHHGLARYGSAPGSFLAAVADIVRGGGGDAPSQHKQQQQPPGGAAAVSRFFSGESSGLTSCESSCRTDTAVPRLQRAYGGSGEINVPPPALARQPGLAGAGTTSPLLRHSSSPAGFLSRLVTDPHAHDLALLGRVQSFFRRPRSPSSPPFRLLSPIDQGNGQIRWCLGSKGHATSSFGRSCCHEAAFTVLDIKAYQYTLFFSAILKSKGNGGMAGTRGVMGSYSQGAGVDAMAQQRRLSSQWSFSRQDMMPHIAEMGMGMPGADIGESIATNCSSDLSRSFSMGSWDDANSIMFSSPSKKARVAADGDDGMFGLEMSGNGMDDYLQLQQDSIACRVRAKRGCATHPRSIAERERRTRISKRLRKLQELVPNMDKQTNTSEMLDIAVDYIKVLQDQIEKLKQDQGNCSCSAAKQEC